jgi:hypothetical protein
MKFFAARLFSLGWKTFAGKIYLDELSVDIALYALVKQRKTSLAFRRF